MDVWGTQKREKLCNKFSLLLLWIAIGQTLMTGTILAAYFDPDTQHMLQQAQVMMHNAPAALDHAMTILDEFCSVLIPKLDPKHAGICQWNTTLAASAFWS